MQKYEKNVRKQERRTRMLCQCYMVESICNKYKTDSIVIVVSLYQIIHVKLNNYEPFVFIIIVVRE